MPPYLGSELFEQSQQIFLFSATCNRGQTMNSVHLIIRSVEGAA